MTQGRGNSWRLIQRALPPIVLSMLLLFQLSHLYIEWVRSQVPLYSSFYTVQEEDRPFLPRYDELKGLAIQLGAQQGIGLNDQSVDAGFTLDAVRVTVRARGHPDWGKFFVDYGEEVRRAMLARWERTRLMSRCTCISNSRVTFKGWSASRGSWIRPLDLVSLAGLAIALVMWMVGRRPSWVQ